MQIKPAGAEPRFQFNTVNYMETQFITDAKGNKKAIILPIKKYEKMLEELEELEDIRLYDEAKARNEEYIPFEEYVEQRKKRDAKL